MRSLRNVVLVDGARLPFQPSSTVYNKLVAYDLARLALTGILTKTGVSPNAIDYVLMGTVIQEVWLPPSHTLCPPSLKHDALALTGTARLDGVARVRPKTRILRATPACQRGSRRACRRTP